MKKSIKLLGSAALSAALVMGTAIPAFADTSSVAADNKSGVGSDGAIAYVGSDQSQGTGETAVNITTYTSQISVTVPLNVTFSLDTTGGTGYAPTNYKIKNGTVVPVKVTKAVATEDQTTGYGFGTTASTASGQDSVSGASIGDMYAKFTPKPGADSTATSTVELEQSLNAGDQNLDWVIAAKPTNAVVTYAWNSNTYNDLASLKTAITSANSSLNSFKTVVNAAQSVEDINGAFDDFPTAVGGKVETSGSDTTDLEFDINVASSVLKNAADKTSAAKIVYTVAVA